MRLNMIMNYPNTESPFSNHSTFALYLEPVYNQLLQTYQNIITLDCLPCGPISQLVSRINFPKLSPFQTNSSTFHGEQCVYTLMRYPGPKRHDSFMYSDDIPSIFAYLQNNGYTIDNHLNSNISLYNTLGGISNSRPSGNRVFIAFISTTPNT